MAIDFLQQPKSQLARNPEGVYANACGTQLNTPVEPGLISTVRDLVGAIEENENLVSTIKDSLGILQPAKDGSIGPEPGRASLVQVVRSAIYRVNSTNAHLRDILGNLNN